MGDSNGKLQDLTNRLADRATAYGMEVSKEKNKIMTNSMNNISADISMDGQKLEEVTSLKYLGRNPVQGWHLLNSNPHQDCLRNCSNGQTEKNLMVQHHQLHR